MSDTSAIGRDSGALNSTLAHYQQILTKKTTENIKVETKSSAHHADLQSNPNKGSKQQKASEPSAGLNHIYKPIFQWKKDSEKGTESFHIIPTEKAETFRSLHQLKNESSNHILSLLGYKINIAEQINQFEQKLQKFFIESKSHNALVGKFSELKFGLMSTLLSLLGVEPNTIEKLKKEALKTAVQDTIDAFEQNELNAELLNIFTNTKNDKVRIKILYTLRKQLIKQMQNYGQPGYFTKERIYNIQKNQVKKILDDLLEEKQNLMFIRNFQ